MEITTVIYRVFKQGDVIALFPTLPGTADCLTCMSYMHVGQHGAADPYGLISHTRLAAPEEYKNLHRELEYIGYKLNVSKKITCAMHNKRMLTYK